MLLPALATAKERARTGNCVSNTRQMLVATRLYTGDHSDYFSRTPTLVPMDLGFENRGSALVSGRSKPDAAGGDLAFVILFRPANFPSSLLARADT